MKLIAVKGDITALAVDAIVNAANSELQAGGGASDQDPPFTRLLGADSWG